MAVFARYLPVALLALTLGFTGSAALADDDHHHHKKNTIVDKLVAIDGAQALVAAVLIVDRELDAGLVDLLSDKHKRFTVLAPSNAAFATLLGQDPGALDGLTVEQVIEALPGLLPTGVGVADVATILAKHVAIKKRSVNRLLKKGAFKAPLAESSYPVSIGATGVSVNYETTIIKGDVWASNGFIHFIDTVILDGLLDPPVPGT